MGVDFWEKQSTAGEGCRNGDGVEIVWLHSSTHPLTSCQCFQVGKRFWEAYFVAVGPLCHRRMGKVPEHRETNNLPNRGSISS